MTSLSGMVLNTGGKPQIQRVNRYPSFPVHGRIMPYGLYPVFIHPVLPGETLQSFNMKVRHESMPVANPLTGSWLETWLVYVKLTDLDKDLAESFISDSATSTAYESSGDSDIYFTKSGKIDWVKLCVEKIHASYFRHETEPAETMRTNADGVPRVKVNNKSWYENLAFKGADEALSTTDVSDTYKQMQNFAILQQMNLTEMSYEKYVEMYDGQLPRGTEGDPEILRFARSWTLPSQRVDPSTGVPTAAWKWNDEINLGSKNAKRFNEPGFIICIQTCRPKVYNTNQRASLVGNMWGFTDWYPIYNVDDPTAGIREIETDDTVFEAGTRTDPGEKTLLYDHRDLLSHGEQFVNNWGDAEYAIPVTGFQNFEDAASPEELRGEYINAGNVNALFANTANNFVNYDGMAFMTITGHVKEHTPL